MDPWLRDRYAGVEHAREKPARRREPVNLHRRSLRQADVQLEEVGRRWRRRRRVRGVLLAAAWVTFACVALWVASLWV